MKNLPLGRTHDDDDDDDESHLNTESALCGDNIIACISSQNFALSINLKYI